MCNGIVNDLGNYYYCNKKNCNHEPLKETCVTCLKRFNEMYTHFNYIGEYKKKCSFKFIQHLCFDTSSICEDCFIANSRYNLFKCPLCEVNIVISQKNSNYFDYESKISNTTFF